MENKIELTDELMCRFQMFTNFHRPINSHDLRILWIKFSPDGRSLIAGSNKRTIQLYNCNTGQQENYFRLWKHGIGAIDYMDSNDMVLVGSHASKGDYAVRELNMTKNVYDATSYIGHSAPVCSMAVNREKKYFVTGGYDKAAMVFDFRVPDAQNIRSDFPCPPLVALHPTTTICALGIDNNRIELYDLRSMKMGPFSIFKMNMDNAKWTNVKFSPDGKQLLISSSATKIRVINSVNGAIQEVFGSRKNTMNIPIDASFTPESDYILSGSSDGNVHIYSNNRKDRRRAAVLVEQKVAELCSREPEAITAVEMGTKYTLMVTASSYVAFWAPNDAN